MISNATAHAEETIREAERAAEEAVIAAGIKLSTAMSYEDSIFQTRAECRATNEALMADEEYSNNDWDDNDDSDDGDKEDGSDGGVAPGGGEVLLPRSRSSRGRGGYFRGGGRNRGESGGMGLGFLVVGGVIAGGGPAGLGGLAQLDGQLGRGPVRGGV